MEKSILVSSPFDVAPRWVKTNLQLDPELLPLGGAADPEQQGAAESGREVRLICSQ